MREFFASWLVSFLALLIIDSFSASVNFSGGWKSMAVLALIMQVLHVTVEPVLQILSIPITILTLGLFYFVVNGIVLLIGFNLTKGAKIRSLSSAIWISIVLSVLESILGGLI